MDLKIFINDIYSPILYEYKLTFVCRGQDTLYTQYIYIYVAYIYTYTRHLSFIFHLKLRHIEMSLRGHMSIDTFFEFRMYNMKIKHIRYYACKLSGNTLHISISEQLIYTYIYIYIYIYIHRRMYVGTHNVRIRGIILVLSALIRLIR